jgi:hypothetical protein
MAIKVLEVDEERIPKEKPPPVLTVPPGREHDIIIEALPKMTHFEIFGRTKVMAPRTVTLMSRLESLRVVESVLSPGQREERKLLPLAWDHPEDIYRYWNYAKLAGGRVLVYRIGLGLFSLMATRAKETHIVEPDMGIRKLVWPTVLGLSSSPKYISDSFVHLGASKFDFAFVDPVPYTGKSDTMLTIDRLPELNTMIAQIRKLMASGGMIAVRGYRSLILKYQEWCQNQVFELRSWNDLWAKEPPPRSAFIEQLFIRYAFKNRKRVLEKRDYKFINAWARSTATSVTV